MSEMIERVARAICSESCEIYEMTPGIHNAVARAAIEAMRNPLSEIHDETEYVIDNDLSRHELNNRFNHVIDVILSDD